MRLNQDSVFLDGMHFPRSKDKMYLFQEQSALENIKYGLFLDWEKCTYAIQEPVFTAFLPALRVISVVKVPLKRAKRE